MTSFVCFTQQFLVLSTHILTRRMTCIFVQRSIYCCLSTHILTRRMTKSIFFFFIKCSLSTHILTRRMTEILHRFCKRSVFQLTSSQGGWRRYYINHHNTLIFQLTSSQGGWQGIEPSTFCLQGLSTHILTRRMTVTDGRLLRRKVVLSTHILTRRMTCNDIFLAVFPYLSTHILTRRMTSIRSLSIQNL